MNKEMLAKMLIGGYKNKRMAIFDKAIRKRDYAEIVAGVITELHKLRREYKEDGLDYDVVYDPEKYPMHIVQEVTLPAYLCLFDVEERVIVDLFGEDVLLTVNYFKDAHIRKTALPDLFINGIFLVVADYIATLALFMILDKRVAYEAKIGEVLRFLEIEYNDTYEVLETVTEVLWAVLEVLKRMTSKDYFSNAGAHYMKTGEIFDFVNLLKYKNNE